MTTPNRLVPYLTALFGTLLTAYIGLVVVTIMYATVETKLSNQMSDTQSQITVLESSYYNSVALLDATDPATVGLVKPAKVQFVTASLPGLSLATR